MGELLIILLVVLVLFGGSRLPQLGGAIGQAIRNFKRGFGGGEDAAEEKKDPAMMSSGGPGQTADGERSRASTKAS
jgi:sec-independent protein translocase protein TatA